MRCVRGEAEEEADTAVVSATTTTQQIACLSPAQQSMEY
jgi:hypothetical protein